MAFCWLSSSTIARPVEASLSPLSDVVFGSSASALVTKALACCLSSNVRKILLA